MFGYSLFSGFIELVKVFYCFRTEFCNFYSIKIVEVRYFNCGKFFAENKT